MMIVPIFALCAPAASLPQDYGPPNHLAASLEFMAEVQAADMDGDGDEDLVAVGLDGTIRWFRSDGAGSVVGVEGIADGLDSANTCTVVDFDGDGDLDVVVADVGGRSITWRRNDGTGRFGGAEPIVEDLSVGSKGGVLDVDGDGDLDVMYGRQDPGLARLVWRSNDGSGGFAQEQIIGSGFTYAPTLYDVDGDGDLDVLALGGNLQLGWWENLGAGAFSSSLITSTPVSGFGMSDLDGDGDLDLHVTGNQQPGLVQIIPNDGAGGFGPASTLFASTGQPLQIVVMDVNGDGQDDLVISTAADREVIWCRGLGALAFGAPEVIHAFDSLPRLAVFDADSDGDADLAIGLSSPFGFSRLMVGENTGSAPYLQLKEVMELTANVQAAHFVDLDGDGDQDVVWGRSLDRIIAHENLGAGVTGLRFGPAQVLVANTPGRERTISSADMNGDGLMDLLVSAATTGGLTRVGWYPNLGGFQLGQRRGLQGSDAWRTEVSLGDLDGDGLEDVLFARADGNRISWRRSLGGGQFDAMQTLSESVEEAWDVEAGDLDGDGDLDIVYSGDRVVGWMRNDGVLGFGQPTSIVGDTQLRKGQVICADFDLDGDDDLVGPIPGTGSKYGYYEALGAGSFAAPVTIAEGVTTAAIDAADVDRDGDLDLLAHLPDRVVLTENLGGSTFAASRTALADAPLSSGFQAADADGDGDIDLLRLNFELRSATVSVHESHGVFGLDVCGAAVPNSTGAPGELVLEGSPLLTSNSLGLVASSLPPFSFGYFLVGDAPDLVPLVNGSQGTLCLGGSLGRFVGAGQIQSSGAGGTFGIQVDLTAIPLSAGPVASGFGSTWYFQAWHRDANPNPTSNFTSARSVLVR